MGGFTNPLQWGCDGSKIPKTVENFIGQHEKLHAANMSACKAKHSCSSGAVALQDSFYRIQIGSWVLGDLFADSTGVRFHDMSRMTPGTVNFYFSTEFN
jgi:hypothetical protein